MKSRTLALCTAGVLAAGLATAAGAAPQDRNGYRPGSGQIEKDPITGYSVAAGATIYNRPIMYPNAPSYEEVAAKVSEIVTKQRQEAVALQALVPGARTAGFTNVTVVYGRMADDHLQIAGFGERWLEQRRFPVPPPPPAVTLAADVTPEASVDHQIGLHKTAFNESLDARRGERSSTVRTMRIWAAATTNCHLSFLHTLDSDIERGRKDLSARLQLQLRDRILTASEQSELMVRVSREETTYFQSLNPLQTQVAMPIQVAEVERPVVVEKPVAAVPPPPAAVKPEPPVAQPVPERVAVQPAPRPKAYTPAPRSRVAGQRRVRRPAY